MKKIYLIEKDNNIIIKFELEVMYKKHEIEIELQLVDVHERNKNVDLTENELKEKLREENKELKIKVEYLENELKNIKEMIKNDSNINKNLMRNISSIMKDNEFDLIHIAIKNRLNKEVKSLKKLYQASIDGDGAINFHSRCDNIPNTLVLFQSVGNRRFGGFTTAQWSSTAYYQRIDDPYSFLFSLDKQRIYSYKKKSEAIVNYKDWGPNFGDNDIGVTMNYLQLNRLFTHERSLKSSYNYYGDKNALSEDGEHKGICAAEVEVFQVIFS